MDSHQKNKAHYDRVMSRVFNRSRTSLRSSSNVTRHEVPSSVRVGAKPSVSAVSSSVFSELPTVLNDYVPEVKINKVVKRPSVRPRRTLKSMDPSKAKSPSRPPRTRGSDNVGNIRARSSVPTVLSNNGEEWSESHVRQCYSSRCHTRLKELKDEIKAFRETDKLMKMRSHLYKSCGVVLDDVGAVAQDKGVQADPEPGTPYTCTPYPERGSQRAVGRGAVAVGRRAVRSRYRQFDLRRRPVRSTRFASKNNMAVWSTEAITEFIRLFRQHSCLWKVKTREYTNRHFKNEAYDDLVEYCKKLGFTSANRDFVSKKIQNLRGAFRKELKKVTDARKQGEINYRPSLWYYDLLYFTKDQDVEDDNNYNKEEESESSSDQPSYSTYSTYTPQTTSDASPSLPPKISSPPIRDYMFAEESNVLEHIAPRKVLKRKAVVTDTQIKLMKVCTEVLKRKEMSEFDGFAVSVAKKLEKMDSIQALYAESIIHSVLKRGILNRLTEATDICDKQCNKNMYSSPRPSSAASSDHAAAVYHGVQGGEVATSENLYDNVFEESSGLKMESE